MRKILVLGAYGMLGHDVFSYLDSLEESQVKGTVRKIDHQANKSLNISSKDLFLFDALDPTKIIEIIDAFKPDVIVNCIGDIVCRNLKTCFFVNSYLPQYLSRLTYQRKIIFIHVSSDGVFSGKKGNYLDSDLPDPQDNYGFSKTSGEMLRGGVVIRTSLIGENVIKPKKGLIDWMLSSGDEVIGYTDRIWSGVTTLELAKNIRPLFHLSPQEFHIIQLSSRPISKYKLLEAINEVYGLRKKVFPKHAGKIDRSLIPSPNFSVNKTIHSQLIEYRQFKGG